MYRHLCELTNTGSWWPPAKAAATVGRRNTAGVIQAPMPRCESEAIRKSKNPVKALPGKDYGCGAKFERDTAINSE